MSMFLKDSILRMERRQSERKVTDMVKEGGMGRYKFIFNLFCCCLMMNKPAMCASSEKMCASVLINFAFFTFLLLFSFSLSFRNWNAATIKPILCSSLPNFMVRRAAFQFRPARIVYNCWKLDLTISIVKSSPTQSKHPPRRSWLLFYYLRN